MNLLANEQTITSSNENKVILTNLRLQTKDKDWGQSYSNTIFLEDISSIEVRYKSNIIFLILAGLALLMWAAQSMNSFSSGGQSTFAFVIAVVFALLYWFTRRHVISVTPDGGKAINFVVSNMGTQQIEDFVDKVQVAKMERITQLYKL